VIKAHGSHPATSKLCFDVLASASDGMAPSGTFGLVHGLAAGAALVGHPAIQAVGFTGSHAGAQGLLSVINQRPDPIPFFGELGSVNPVVVTPQAAQERAAELGRAAAGSFTLGGGQFCTKPGLVFVPTGAEGDALVHAMAAEVRATGPQCMLNEGIADAYAAGTNTLSAQRALSVLAEGVAATGEGFEAVPLLLGTSVAELRRQALTECFGPVTVVVRYADDEELLGALALLPASLTASVFRGAGETRLPLRLGHHLRQRAGRLIYDGFPTGVAVSWAQHHGGPWPSTNSQHTSVGATSIRRFLRPIAWQDAPSEVLPAELQDGTADIPRRVNGALQLPRKVHQS
jgi:NADP-dependent aldehyde dehydrogenase